MLEILKKAGVASGIATLLVLAITFVPIYYQFVGMKEFKVELEALKAEVATLKGEAK